VTTPAQLRKAALALPETTEGKPFGSAAFFSVRGRGFASLNALVKAAWVNNAPKQLVVRLAEANDANHVGDLPANLSKPALRALHTAGITSLRQAATWSESDLLQLHGVGPRAIRLLDEALRKRGNPLR
jgi:hypothetical protein